MLYRYDIRILFEIIVLLYTDFYIIYVLNKPLKSLIYQRETLQHFSYDTCPH